MKKKNVSLSKKLLLQKENIAVLNAGQIKGGFSFDCSIRGTCPPNCVNSIGGTCFGSACICSGG
ncbi:class I lanthipeptide [Taibaiella koreensis]|uniref:class I lanthipeptide n=1 Tax=Taibaiella koreensis TaxID=1268548 RepID=UPI0013C2F569|nr:class I lanthipeptide [Taibaiella koreensis]